MFVDAGLDEADVTIDSIIPGYFRRSKNWDVVAMHRGHLVGVVELKSQESSPGNNANNRIEEAVGSAVEPTRQRADRRIRNPRGLAAWCMTFNRNCETGKPIKPVPPRRLRRLPAIDPAFQHMTYATQYATAIERFI